MWAKFPEQLTQKNEQIEWTKLGKGSTITEGLVRLHAGTEMHVDVHT